MLSVIVPAYKEPYLNKTLESLLQNEGEVEIIPVIDGYPLNEPLPEDPRIKPVLLERNRGMRGAINAGLERATGDRISKIDAHCVVCPGYDRIVGEDNWLMIPRRYGLDEWNWVRSDKKIIDYHYLTFPGKDDPRYGYSFQVQPLKREGPPIDDTMTFQGSFWIANRNYFMKHVGFLDSKCYGTFAQEQQEIGLKYWLGGGQVKVNKNFWYGHLFKQNRHYHTGEFSSRHKRDKAHINGNEYSTKHWMDNEEPGMTRPFSWLVEKFWPLPDWDDNWQEIWNREKLAHFC